MNHDAGANVVGIKERERNRPAFTEEILSVSKNRDERRPDQEDSILHPEKRE